MPASRFQALENVFDEVVWAPTREVADVACGILRFRRIAITLRGGPHLCAGEHWIRHVRGVRHDAAALNDLKAHQASLMPLELEKRGRVIPLTPPARGLTCVGPFRKFDHQETQTC